MRTDENTDVDYCGEYLGFGIGGKSIMNNGTQCLDNVSTVKQEVGGSFDFSSNSSKQCLDGVSKVKQDVGDSIDITSKRLCI